MAKKAKATKATKATKPAKASSPTPKSSKLWTVLSTASALGAAALARKGLDTGWRLATGRKPPENPADPDVAVREAVAWATVTGALIALARMFAQRRAAGYYRKSAGHLPPQLQHDGS